MQTLDVRIKVTRAVMRESGQFDNGCSVYDNIAVRDGQDSNGSWQYTERISQVNILGGWARLQRCGCGRTQSSVWKHEAATFTKAAVASETVRLTNRFLWFISTAHLSGALVGLTFSDPSNPFVHHIAFCVSSSLMDSQAQWNWPQLSDQLSNQLSDQLSDHLESFR